MNIYIDDQKNEFSAVINHFTNELTHIRSGHANPELIEGIKANVYDTLTPINQLASITVPEPKLLVIQPWDKSILKEIEKAITTANLGFSPVNDGNVIRISMPPLTEENRRDLVKLIKEKAEKSRITIRQIRDSVKEKITKAQKDKEITEDDKFRYLKQLDEYTSEQTKQITELALKKEAKIMTI